MRVLVTGSRHWKNAAFIRMVLDRVAEVYGSGNLTIVHGACPSGADLIADQWARENAGRGVVVEPHPANWKRWGAAAGPIRNTEMVDLDAEVCLAFIDPGSRGTLDCARKAEQAGIRVRPFHSSALDESLAGRSV
jgi:hypothetical protein